MKIIPLESIFLAVAVGASVIAVFAFPCWLAYRYRVGASKRLNSYIGEDGVMSFLMTLLCIYAIIIARVRWNRS